MRIASITFVICYLSRGPAQLLGHMALKKRVSLDENAMAEKDAKIAELTKGLDKSRANLSDVIKEKNDLAGGNKKLA